jgi:cyclic pyranopterin monophosphate synthase
MEKLSHLDRDGRARMVNVTEKTMTVRIARAKGLVRMSSQAVRQIQDRSLTKGNALETARIAGVLGAKRTSQLIPLCHPLLLTHVDVECAILEQGIEIEAIVSAEGKTGVEMEALTAVSVAALTIYDMCKAVDKGMVISDIRLIEKSGGRSGHYLRKD